MFQIGTIKKKIQQPRMYDLFPLYDRTNVHYGNSVTLIIFQSALFSTCGILISN